MKTKRVNNIQQFTCIAKIKEKSKNQIRKHNKKKTQKTIGNLHYNKA